MKIPRLLSVLETWSFGLTGHMGWVITIPGLLLALGTNSLYVLIPVIIGGMILNYQVSNVSARIPELAGGTGIYASYLLNNSLLGRYFAFCYYIDWLPASIFGADIVLELIHINIAPFNLGNYDIILRFVLSILPYVIAVAGSRPLAILHLFLIIPTCILLACFGVQGLINYDNTTLLNAGTESLDVATWFKWVFITAFTVFSCETSAVVTADSVSPIQTTKFIKFAAYLIPVAFLLTAVVLLPQASHHISKTAYELVLNSCIQTFGYNAPLVTVLLISLSGILTSATGAVIGLRILFQIGKNSKFPSGLVTITERGAFPVSTIVSTIILSLLLFLNPEDLVSIFATSTLLTIIGFHLGLCKSKHRINVVLSFFLLCIEIPALFVSAFFHPIESCIGFLLPLGMLIVNKPLHKFSFRIYKKVISKIRISRQGLGFQLATLLVMLSSSNLIVWFLIEKLSILDRIHRINVLAVVILIICCIGVVVISWTSLTQLLSLEESITKKTKDLELTLRELERISDIKDEFLSTVSHELRTPISNMKVALRLLTLIPAKREEYLDILNKECEKEEVLINNLLDIKRLECDKYNMELQNIDLSDLIYSTVYNFKPRTLENNLAITVEVAEAAIVCSDVRNIERILSELLNNACKYSDKNSKIRVKLYKLVNSVCISVSNSASIPEAELPKLFDKLYRVPNSDRWKEGGSGLGLSLIKQLAEFMNYSITVSSSHNLTTFILYIPKTATT